MSVDQEHFEIISSVKSGDVVVEVLSYSRLEGSSDPRTAERLYFANQSGMRIKMVRLRMTDTYARIEPGALYYMKGQLEMKASTGGGILKGLARKLVSGETFFVNEVHGSGDVYLEPTFGHFLLHHVTPNEGGIICDKGMFYAGTAGLDISAAPQKTVSASLFGGEGLIQTKISGSGIAVLFCPVPASEVQRLTLNGDSLVVDGNFALMRSAGVTMTAGKSSKGWLSTSVSGEGLVVKFSGHGHVWLAPTQGIYERLATEEGLQLLSRPPGVMHTTTESSS